MSDENKESRLDEAESHRSGEVTAQIEATTSKTDKWESFSNWIHCICVVTFDLELGQVIESVFPQHVNLSKPEATSICYLAFPDSNSGCMGNTYFTVRLKQGPGNVGLSKTHAAYNKKCSSTLEVQPGYFWGYVYFRQVKDPNLPRGYFQKSVVILSRLPFCNLFQKLSSLIAPEFFSKGPLSLEAACHNINSWSPPIPGEVINLPILGTVVRVQIPAQKAVNNSTTKTEIATSSIDGPVLPLSLTDNTLFETILPVLSHIYTLWELVLTAEPLIVMASSPTNCSALVVALTSIISPLRYCVDHRPYFTIHDNDFKEFTGSVIRNPLLILGVTNPFFSKTLDHWPHTIRLGDDPSGSLKYKLKKSANTTKVLDSSPGFYTSYKPFLQKDKSVIKKLLLGISSKRPLEAQTAMLNQHLSELTVSFMIPLERYIGSLMPLQKNISAFRAAPNPLPFKQDDFFATLENFGPQLTSGVKGDWEGLYKKFFRSPNFNGWFHMRYRELALTLQAFQLQALAEADLKNWVVDKPEVEVVDMVLKIKNKLDKCKEYDLPVTKETKHRLHTRLEEIFCTLPEDLKKILDIS